MNADYMLVIYFALLSKRRKVKRSELASRAGVNVRTVSRAIDSLTLAGVPVYAETGPNGGYYIPDDYVVNRASFSAEEKARMINCIHAARGNFADNVCDCVLDKLNCLAAAPEENYLIRSDTLIIDASGWNEPQSTRAKMDVLRRATEETRTIRMKYVDRHEFASERLFDPYCLVQKSGMWYVYGWCHTRKDFRLFKMARIEDITATDRVFQKRPHNVYEKLRGDFAHEDTVQLELQFNNFVLPEIEEWLGTECIEDRGRCYVARAELYGGNQLLQKILSFGSDVCVLSPPELREKVAEECKRMISSYAPN